MWLLFGAKNNKIMKYINLKKAVIRNDKCKIMAKSIFVKELNWKVVLPSKVANFLFYKLEDGSPFSNFRIEIALYFLSLITSIPARKKYGVYDLGYVPLHSKLLEKIKYNYKSYFKYFEKINLLQKRNYSTDKSRCNSWRYNYKEIKMIGEQNLEFKIFDFSNFSDKKSIKNFNLGANISENCSHLTEWFDQGLHLDYERFISENTVNFEINKFDDERILNRKMLNARNYFFKAFQFKNQIWRAKRDETSDNRLHTNLTNLDKSIRDYVRYQGEPIKSLDIKNSQPYFLILFIEECLKISNNNNFSNYRLDTIFKKIYGNKCTMFKKLSQFTDNELFMKEFSAIKDSVISGKYYEFLGDIFIDIKPYQVVKENGLDIEYYKEYFYDKNWNRNILEQFTGKRDLMKKVSMQILYTPLEKTGKFYKIFKEKFPELSKFMEILKTSTDDEGSYKLFPKLLQHFEADCVLDFVTKKLAEKFPEMPLFTIHDSIATQWCCFGDLEKEVRSLMIEYSDGMPPILASDYWGDVYPYDNVA